MAVLRVALLGGSESLRAAKRLILEVQPSFQIVFDSDGFDLTPQNFMEVNFDVAIIEQRLGSQSAFDFIRTLHTLARGDSEALGQILVASQYRENNLRITAIESGAVDCVFVSEGPLSLIEKIKSCSDPQTDFAIRELIPVLGNQKVSQESFQSAALVLDVLDEYEALILKAFCQLKSDTAISSEVGVSKIKVRSALLKIQKLLLLDTRSQLLLRMYRLGALAL